MFGHREGIEIGDMKVSHAQVRKRHRMHAAQAADRNPAASLYRLLVGGDPADVSTERIGIVELCHSSGSPCFVPDKMIVAPQAYMRYVLTHLPEHPSNRVAELLPWHVAEHLVEPLAQAAA